MDKIAVELKWVGITLVLEFIAGLVSIQYLAPSTPVFGLGNPLTLGVLSVCLYLALLAKKHKYFGGRISFSKAFRTGAILGFLVAFMQPLLYFITQNLFASSSTALGNTSSIVGIILLYLVLSATLSLILKRNRPSDQF